MYSAESLHIDLKELAEEITTFEYVLDSTYFEAIEAPEIKKGLLKCVLTVRKTDHFFELDFHTEGVVQIPCDRCLEDMDQVICTNNKLIAKFGDVYSDECDIITVREDDSLDVSWFIYEFVVLSIPMKHVHDDGKCNEAMMALLNGHSIAETNIDEPVQNVDPRWSKLSELIKKN